MMFPRRLALVLAWLFIGALSGRAQDSPLKGLAAVQVVVNWNGKVDADLQSSIELKIRQAGLIVLTEEQRTQMYGSMLFIGIGAGDTAVPLIVEVSDKAYTFRGINSRMKFTAFNEYLDWLAARKKESIPITEAEDKEHQAMIFAEAKRNDNTPLSQVLVNPTDAATWLRYGIAQAAQPETVKEIVARYASHPYWQTPAGREMLQPLMDAEVKGALARQQSPMQATTVIDTVKTYVDAFVSDWLAANTGKR